MKKDVTLINNKMENAHGIKTEIDSIHLTLFNGTCDNVNGYVNTLSEKKAYDYNAEIQNLGNTIQYICSQAMLLDSPEAFARTFQIAEQCRASTIAQRLKKKLLVDNLAAIETELIANPGIALLQFIVTEQTGYAIVVTVVSGKCQYQMMKLPEFSEMKLKPLIAQWQSETCNSHKNNIKNSAGNFGNESENSLLRLSVIVKDVWSLLPVGCHVVICPHVILGVLPFHVFYLDYNSRRRVIDDFIVSYTPKYSFFYQKGIVKYSNDPDKQYANVSIASTHGELWGAIAEMHAVREWHRPIDLLFSFADRDVISFAKKRPLYLWNYSGHAVHDWSNPRKSRLVFSRDTEQRCLFVEQILNLDFRGLCLADLSGCETNLFDLEKAHDPIGLSTGFLYAGAACVLASLWSVEDVSTALLKKRFYESWRPGKGVAEVLRASQLWLRDLPGSAVAGELAPLLAEMRKDRQHRAAVAHLVWAAGEYAKQAKPFAGIAYWAPFTANGIGWAYNVSENGEIQ